MDIRKQIEELKGEIKRFRNLAGIESYDIILAEDRAKLQLLKKLQKEISDEIRDIPMPSDIYLELRKRILGEQRGGE